MSAGTVDALSYDQSPVAPGANPVATIVPRLSRSGRRIAETITGGAERYFEHWEDLVVEARATLRAPDQGLSVGETLALLSEAKVESDLPGRVRLRLKQLRGRKSLAAQTAGALEGVEGVERVEASALTGSVLIFYDSRRYGSREALLGAVGAQT
jgi:Heavy metal associated domain 2